jgi:hypothetical protein
VGQRAGHTTQYSTANPSVEIQIRSGHFFRWDVGCDPSDPFTCSGWRRFQFQAFRFFTPYYTTAFMNGFLRIYDSAATGGYTVGTISFHGNEVAVPAPAPAALLTAGSILLGAYAWYRARSGRFGRG